MAFVYNNAAKLLSGSYWTGTTLKCALVGPAYVADRDDVFVSVLGSSELSGSGYTRGFNSPGRKTLAGKSVVVNNALNRTNYLASDTSWSAVSAGNMNGLVILQEVTTDADSLLIAYIDSATTVNPVGNDVPALFENGIVFTQST